MKRFFIVGIVALLVATFASSAQADRRRFFGQRRHHFNNNTVVVVEHPVVVSAGFVGSPLVRVNTNPYAQQPVLVPASTLFFLRQQAPVVTFDGHCSPPVIQLSGHRCW